MKQITLDEFKSSMMPSADKMLDIISNGGEYQEKFDIIICLNENMVRIPLHADSFSYLEQFIEKAITDFE